MNKFELHVTVTASDSTVISALTDQCDLSTAQLKKAIAKGALWLTRNGKTQRTRRLKNTLKTQDILHFYYDEQILNQTTEPAQLIADLKDYSVWFKPYGMLSQGSKWSDHCTISRYAQTNLTPERPVFIVHRLDRAATGLILVAHSKKAARALSTMFEHHQLEKYYHIIVHGNHGDHPQPEVITQDIDGKTACSAFTLVEYNEEHNLSLIKVKIESGRKHQIRKHAASINLPIVGDRLHGRKDIIYPENLNLQLSAVSLKFTCPLYGQAQSFQLPAELSPQLENVINTH
ncbi:MAG: RluA family pseudouridine synthase [Alteromonadaceae bacterium]|nr:RluA family pseudouridine synthase [Alteromonadaceae bacterium]